MWRTSTRVLRSTACLLAVLCFVFLRISVVSAQGGESSVKGCSEIFNVCSSEAPSILLEGKPHPDSKKVSKKDSKKYSKFDSPLGEQFDFNLFEGAGFKTQGPQGFAGASLLAGRRPLWLINQALLI